MKKYFYHFMFWALMAAGLSHALPEDSKYKALAINHDSMRVISREELAPNYHVAVLEFQILPTNNCEDNYAGVFESKDNDFTVLYTYRLGQPCPNFAYARYVRHAFHLRGDINAIDLRVNDKAYGLKKHAEAWKVELKKS